jgi:hypothetical protein
MQMCGIRFKYPLLFSVLRGGMPEALDGKHGVRGFRHGDDGRIAAIEAMVDKNRRNRCGKKKNAEK